MHESARESLLEESLQVQQLAHESSRDLRLDLVSLEASVNDRTIGEWRLKRDCNGVLPNDVSTYLHVKECLSLLVFTVFRIYRWYRRVSIATTSLQSRHRKPKRRQKFPP